MRERSSWLRDRQKVFHSFKQTEKEIKEFFEKMISLNLPTKETKLNMKYDSLDEDDYGFKDGSAEVINKTSFSKVKMLKRSNLEMGKRKTQDIRSFMTKKGPNATHRAPAKVSFNR